MPGLETVTWRTNGLCEPSGWRFCIDIEPDLSFTVLIVGLGQIGMSYDLALDPAAHVYTHARAFREHPKFCLVGGVDIDAKRREIFTRTYSCPAYADLASALREHDPAVVVIAVPTQFHDATLRHILQLSRPQTVLCEKPLAYKLEEAHRMVAACSARGVRLYVNYMRRSDEGAIECKRRLDSGEIVAPVKGVAWYSKGFLHNGSHLFNLLEYWLGSVRSARMLSHGRLWAEIDPEPDVQVEFDRGTVMFLAAWEEAFSHYTIELLSPSGRLRYEQGGKLIQWQGIRADRDLPTYTMLSSTVEIIPGGMRRYQWHVAEQLARVLEGQEASLCTGTDALNTLIGMQKVLEQE